MSGRSSCRPAPLSPPSLPPSLRFWVQSVRGSRSARAGLTGLGRPAWLFAGRSRRQSVPRLLPWGRPRVRTGGQRGSGCGSRRARRAGRPQGWERSSSFITESTVGSAPSARAGLATRRGSGETQGRGDEGSAEGQVSACTRPTSASPAGAPHPRGPPGGPSKTPSSRRSVLIASFSRSHFWILPLPLDSRAAPF